MRLPTWSTDTLSPDVALTLDDLSGIYADMTRADTFTVLEVLHALLRVPTLHPARRQMLSRLAQEVGENMSYASVPFS